MKKRRFNINGEFYDIPDTEAESFLSDNPHAQEVRNYNVQGKEYNVPLHEADAFETDMGLKKKEAAPSVSSNGQSTSQSQSQPYDISQNTPEFHVGQPKENPYTVDNNFGISTNGAPTQSASDNTTVSSQPIADTENLGFKYQHDKKAQKQNQQFRDAAIDNTVQRSLKLKGLDAPKGSLLYNIEASTYNRQLADGNAVFGVKNGVPGLEKTTGVLESFHNHMMDAINENKNSREFKDMTPEQRVGFLDKLDKNKDEYIGEHPSNDVAALTGAAGGFTPTLGLYGAGGAIGGLLEAAAPETGGLSNLALKPVMSFVTNAGSEANKAGFNGTRQRYNAILQDHPEMDKVEAMKKATAGEDIDRLAGIGTAALFSTTGNVLGNSVTKTFINDALKSGVDIGAKSALVEGAKDVGHNIEGVTNKKVGDILTDMGTAFAENAPAGMALHAFMGAVTGVANLPNLIKSGVKYDVVTKMQPDEVNSELDKNVQSGAITPDDAQKAKTDLHEYGSALQSIPPELSDESKASIAGLIQKREHIKQEASTKDVTAQHVYKKQVDAINKQISDIQTTGNPIEHEIDESTGKTYAGQNQEAEQTEIPKPTETASTTDEGTDKNIQPTEVAKEEPDEKLLNDAKDLVNSDVVKGYSADPLKEAANNDPEKFKTYLSNIAGQANDEQSLKPTIETYGQPLVDIATKLFPKEAESETPPPEPPKKEEPIEEGDKGKEVGVSHKAITELTGKEPARGEYTSPEQYADRGRELLKEGATVEDRDNKKLDLHDRIAIARANLEDLQTKADKAEKDFGVKSEEYKIASNEVDKYANDTVKKLGTLAHRAMVSLQGKRDINTGSFTEVKKAYESSKGSKADDKQTQKIKDLTTEVENLRQQAKEADAKIIEATDKNINEEKPTEPNSKGKFEKQFKDIADKFRKLKTKTFKFKGEDGKEYEITQMGLSWNDMVELGAKVIEKTGKIADGVAEIIDKIKETDFYKGLSDKDKEGLAKQLTAHYEGASKSESKLSDLQEMFADKSRKDKKFTTEEAKALWEYAKKEYLEKGVPYKDMISYVSNDTGLSFEQVYNALVTPKTKPIVDAMWMKQKELRKAQVKTKDFVDNANKSLFTKIIETPDKIMRGTAVFGHGGIFVGTHAGMTTFDLPRAKYTVKAFANGYKYAYGSEAKYEYQMNKLKSDPNYILAQRAGLQNDPNETKTDQYQKSQTWLGNISLGKVGKVFKVMAESGVKGFNAIKVLRQDLFNDHFNRLTPAEKADPEVARSIAELVNNATGATNLDLKLRDKQGNVAVDPDKIMFAANMEAARWEKLTKNPFKATKTALTALFSDKATPAEKVFAKVWARRVGWELSTYAGLAITNAAIQHFLNPKNPVNLTDPTKPDYLKYKVGNTDVNMTSGMLGAIDFVAGLVHNSLMSKKERRGDNVLQADAKSAFQYGRGKLSPFASTLVDLKTGTDYSQNTLPYNSDKPQAGKHQLTWGEYLFQKAPIPVADAAKTMYDSMLDNGMNKITADHFLKGIISFIEAGSTGFRISDSYQKLTPFNDDDKKKPSFNFFISKGMELPNTALSSVDVTDEKKHTKIPVSEYPKEVQEKYQVEHKKELDKELSGIIKNGIVYVKTYNDAKGNKVNEVSINRPEGKADRVRLQAISDKDKLAQVLRIAESQATKKTKQKIFSTN